MTTGIKQKTLKHFVLQGLCLISFWFYVPITSFPEYIAILPSSILDVVSAAVVPVNDMCIESFTCFKFLMDEQQSVPAEVILD
jgi:hypothetical protein